MSDPQKVLAARVQAALGLVFGEPDVDPAIRPSQFADFQANVALALAKKLGRKPRDIAAEIVERLVEHFGGLQKLLAASIDDLQTVEGVGELRARSVREGLSRLAESSILERYV